MICEYIKLYFLDVFEQLLYSKHASYSFFNLLSGDNNIIIIIIIIIIRTSKHKTNTRRTIITRNIHEHYKTTL